MEVRPGYKRTEVGVIPEEWDVDSLTSVTPKNVRNGIVDGPFGSNLKTIHYRTTGIPIITSGYVTGGEFRADNYLYVEKQKFDEEKRSAVHPGDIVMAKIGARCGASAILPSDHPIGILSGNALKITVDETRHSTGYIWQVLWSLYSEGNVEALRTVGAQPAISMAILKKHKIALPPEPEQRAIAEVLSDVDALLGGLDRLIHKKRDIKQAVMQQLLTEQIRLPGFHGKWEVTTLFDLADRRKELFDDGDWIESEHITTEGIRLIQTGNIGIGCFVEKEVRKFIYEKSFKSLRCKQLRTGDLLVCRLADPAGRACVLPDIGEDRIVTSVDITIFRPPVEVADRVYLVNVFSTPEWFRAISDRSGGTTHKRISRGALGRIPVKLPPLPEQAAIASVLSDMDAELSALESRRDKTRALKQAMMQELLTGKTRLI